MMMMKFLQKEDEMANLVWWQLPVLEVQRLSSGISRGSFDPTNQHLVPENKMSQMHVYRMSEYSGPWGLFWLKLKLKVMFFQFCDIKMPLIPHWCWTIWKHLTLWILRTPSDPINNHKYKYINNYKHKYFPPHAGWGHQVLEPNPGW